MRQTSLFQFMGSSGGGGEASTTPGQGSRRVGGLRRYFYLSFSQGLRPKVDAYFTDTRPQDVRLDIEQTFRACGQEFILCGSLYQDAFPYNPPREKKYRNVGFLKSHLQKCVRKMNAQLGVPTALHYMTLDIKDFLRRICIIMLEDAYLHPSFTTLVWFMVASNLKSGFLWHRRYYDYLMGVVYQIISTRESDPLPVVSEGSGSGGGGVGSLKRLTSYHVLEDRSQVSLLYAMQIRADYGGMKCDVDMLQRYASVWFERFQSDSPSHTLPTAPIRPISFEATTPLKLEDWDKSAIDFHCAPQIMDYLIAKFPHYASRRDLLQQIIWHNSSKINFRLQTEAPRHPEVWEEIRITLSRLQGYLLEENW